MFGSEMIEVGIGIVLLFLMTSLLCTAAREAIETLLKSRAMDMERALREIFDDRDGTGKTQEFFAHPFINSLFSGEYKPEALVSKKVFGGGADTKMMPLAARSNLPAYIPSASFAGALIDLVRDPNAPLSAQSIRTGVVTLPEGRLRTALLAVVDEAQGDLAAIRKSIEAWYDASMERVSGWYKRRTQVILLGLGFAVAVAFNVDAVYVGHRLSTDRAYRAAAVAQAETFLKDNTPPKPAADVPKPSDAKDTTAPKPAAESAKSDPKPDAKEAPKTDVASEAPLDKAERLRRGIEGAGFSLGWPLHQLDGCTRAGCAGRFLAVVLGWIATALGVSLGAPFWFDTLNRLVNIRSTVKPAEKPQKPAKA